MASTVISNNNEYFINGEVWVLNNVWNRQQLTNGIDFTQQCTFDPDNMTQFTFTWDWGADTDTVRSYPEIVVGYKPWDQRGEDVISAKVSDIKTFEISADVDISGNTTGFNVSYDLWLTREELGDKTTISTEVMVWTHKGDWANENANFVGTYVDGNLTFKIVTYDDFSALGVHWRYISLIPGKDCLDATIDMGEVLQKLARLDLISSDDYVTGYELGAEVSHGRGQMQINSLDYSFSTFDADSAGDIIKGSKSADRLVGFNGDDIIRGRAGRDVLQSGGGEDQVWGGRGADRFVFKDSGALADHIADFRHGVDTIVLGQSFLEMFDLSGINKSQDARIFDMLVEGHYLSYDRVTGNLSFDADGEATASEATVIAVLENKAALTGADFDFL
jgi:hypothetical protein